MFNNFLLIILLLPLVIINAQQINLVTLDPGHFHAALIQKTMYDEINSLVYVYAPNGPDVQLHLDRINSYNNREKNPTNWQQKVYAGNDFLEKMLNEKEGNVVIISGNNKKKTEYILKSLKAGFNVLADKPMVIDDNDFEMLNEAFKTAYEKELLLYDIMTERYEITNILQKEFSLIADLFGTLEKGSVENPAITKESVHHLYKFVSGNVLIRPAWFFDVSQEGEGIVDVMTHLVDLVQWECFPEQIIDYENDIKIISVKRWSTQIALDEFKIVTKVDTFPGYLNKHITNDKLNYYCNGEINYKIKDIFVRTFVKWNFKAPDGTGDTHYSIMRGTKANLIIKQGDEENFKTTLYIEPINKNVSTEKILKESLDFINKKYPGIELKKKEDAFEVIIPEKYKEGHEAHFTSVTKKFLEYLKKKNIPDWEIPNMIAKYYTTTKALEIANQ